MVVADLEAVVAHSSSLSSANIAHCFTECVDPTYAVSGLTLTILTGDTFVSNFVEQGTLVCCSTQNLVGDLIQMVVDGPNLVLVLSDSIARDANLHLTSRCGLKSINCVPCDESGLLTVVYELDLTATSKVRQQWHKVFAASRLDSLLASTPCYVRWQATDSTVCPSSVARYLASVIMQSEDDDCLTTCGVVQVAQPILSVQTTINDSISSRLLQSTDETARTNIVGAYLLDVLPSAVPFLRDEAACLHSRPVDANFQATTVVRISSIAWSTTDLVRLRDSLQQLTSATVIHFASNTRSNVTKPNPSLRPVNLAKGRKKKRRSIMTQLRRRAKFAAPPSCRLGPSF